MRLSAASSKGRAFIGINAYQTQGNILSRRTPEYIYRSEKNTTITPRRAFLLLGPGTLSLFGSGGISHANLLEEYARGVLRPDLEKEKALVILLDARSVLREIQMIAATGKGSRERRAINSRLPGMARRLREVGQAAPVLAAELEGITKEQSLSSVYGGTSENRKTTVDKVYEGIGSVLTLTGRGIRPEMIEEKNSAIADAITRLSEFISLLPPEEIRAAEELRNSRT